MAGDAVVTRDGKNVSQITLFDSYSLYPLRAVVGGEIRAFTKDGVNNILSISSDDLFMKKKTHIVNGFEVPAPITNPENMKFGVTYYGADNTDPGWYFGATWQNDGVDVQWMGRNLVFLNKEDAIDNAKAMAGVNPYGGQ